MKVLAIVLGSIVGLVVLAVVAIALLYPTLNKKFENANDPVHQHETANKIADFAIPSGFKIAYALDLGITQTLTIQPVDRSKYSLVLQMTSQHIPAGDDKPYLDQMATSVGLTEKIGGCDLKDEPDETLRAGGKSLTLRSLKCARDGTPLRVELALVRAKASTVQLVATDVRTPADHAALVSFVESIK